MTRFLRVVEAKAAASNWDKPRLALHKIFMKYDGDGSAHVDEAEFAAMVDDILMNASVDEAGRDPDSILSYATEMMQVMDRNKNNLIEEDEFAIWALDAIKISAEDLSVLRAKPESSMHANFIDAISSKVNDGSK